MRSASGGPGRDRLGGSNHAVEHLNGKGDLTLLTGQRAGTQPRADSCLVSSDPSLRQAAATVAGSLLPNHPSLVADASDVPVALGRRPGGLVAAHRRRARRYDGTRGKSPGELPDRRRVSRMKAAKLLGLGMTKRLMPTCMPGVLPHVHAGPATPNWDGPG